MRRQNRPNHATLVTGEPLCFPGVVGTAHAYVKDRAGGTAVMAAVASVRACDVPWNGEG
jgi:hypothetical protein